tara:strand:+ start:36656 stop:40153 length:3498 start_codon:yes stop_codon:yes gene_type:complete
MSDLFSPSTINDLSLPGYTFKSITRSQLTESSPSQDNIWRDDPYGTGLKSTQQIKINWADFTNHTFFNSAESKVNVAFDRIINSYPFDGNKKELMEYEDSLSGFENYVLKRFPKFIGDLKFSKASNQYLVSQDKSGYLFPEISKNILAQRSVGSVASTGKFTIEHWLYVSSSTANDNQTIFQKLNTSNNHGVSLFLSKSTTGDSTASVFFGISSGSTSISASFGVAKGSYQHLAFVYDYAASNSIKIYNNSKLVSSSSSAEIFNLDFLNKNIQIGSGSTHSFDSVPFTPAETFDSSIDEFRFWKSSRSQSLINTYYLENVFQDNNLSLYYRFNEPTGSFLNNNIALDHSGNGLHGQITNFALTMRGTKLQKEMPVAYEKSFNSPVLFPDYADLLSLNSDLLTSASLYDSNNPNLITKLVPAHYFLEGQAFDGLENEFGQLGENYGYNSDGAFPGNGKIPSSQILSSLLFIWGSFFDEIKVYLDSFSKLHDLSHSSMDSVPAQFLQSLGRKYGLNLPNSFSDAKIEPYTNGKNLSNDIPYSNYSLRQIQEHLWRRLLAEVPSIRRMKGTQQSVKSTMLALGVNPDTNFRIREYGGSKTKKLANRYKEYSTWYNSIDFSIGSPFLQSRDVLAGYRHEPGHPFGAGTAEKVLIDLMGAESSTIKVAQPATSPGLTSLSSASWSWEGHYILDPLVKHQSLFRLEHSSSLTAGTKPSICLNLIAVSGSFEINETPKLILAFSGSKNSKLFITGSGIDLHDGSSWWLNVNHIAKDPKSEFLVRAYKTNGTNIIEKHYISGTYDNSIDNGTSHERNRLTAATNQGNRIAIGYNNPSNYTSDLLNYSGDNETNFNGKLAAFRFWSKDLNSLEARTHAMSPMSVAASSPLVNSGYYFKNNQPIQSLSTAIPSGSLPLGSWERIRLAADLNQEISSSNSSGKINIVDITKNSMANRYDSPDLLSSAGFVGYNFTPSTVIFKPIQRMVARLDPDFDVSINVNKVRIASAQDPDTAFELSAENEPVYSLNPRAPITDDRRFSVEASLVMALNEDIVNVMVDNQYINDAMGTPEQMFAVNYPGLEKLSDKYFNRLTDKIDTVEYFKFFKWFDNNFGQLIERLIPRTTEFLGINFVVESHMLERHRYEYKQADVHIDLKSRLAATIDPVLEGIISNEGS